MKANNNDGIYVIVRMANGEIRVELKGNTYPKKDEIKSQGFFWDALHGVWEITCHNKEELRSIFKKCYELGTKKPAVGNDVLHFLVSQEA